MKRSTRGCAWTAAGTRPSVKRRWMRWLSRRSESSKALEARHVTRALRGTAAIALIAARGLSAARVRAQQGGTALTGVVSSSAEGKMEGVLVTARRDGANFDVTVVSDAQGTYSFPRSHIAPGKYAVKIRAIGYDLADPGVADVTA